MRSNHPSISCRLHVWLPVLIAMVLSGPIAEAQDEPGHWAGESVIRLSIGSFEPDGSSSYWREKEIDFNGSTSEFDDLTLSLDYLYFWADRFGALVSFGGWEGQQTQSYREFVDPSGREIAHLTTVSEAWLEIGVVFHLFSSRQFVMPYVGAGASVVFWELAEEGEFIDFDLSPPEIFNDAFFADGDSFGYFVLVGVEIPVSDHVALFAEGRWRSAEEELNQDFAGFGTLDLSGRSIGGGVSIAF